MVYFDVRTVGELVREFYELHKGPDYVDELKVVYDGVHIPERYEHITVRHARFLQPCDTGDHKQNDIIIKKTIEYIKANPQWRLSLQVHKVVGIR